MEHEEEIMKYFRSGYEHNEKFLRLVPTKKYLESSTRVKWMTLVQTILRPSSTERQRSYCIYRKTFRNIVVEAITRQQGEILFIEKVKKNEVLNTTNNTTGKNDGAEQNKAVKASGAEKTRIPISFNRGSIAV